MENIYEKIVFVDLQGEHVFVPEDGWVIRDMKFYDGRALIWLQKQNYFN